MSDLKYYRHTLLNNHIRYKLAQRSSQNNSFLSPHIYIFVPLFSYPIKMCTKFDSAYFSLIEYVLLNGVSKNSSGISLVFSSTTKILSEQ